MFTEGVYRSWYTPSCHLCCFYYDQGQAKEVHGSLQSACMFMFNPSISHPGIYRDFKIQKNKNKNKLTSTLLRPRSTLGAEKLSCAISSGRRQAPHCPAKVAPHVKETQTPTIFHLSSLSLLSLPACRLLSACLEFLFLLPAAYSHTAACIYCISFPAKRHFSDDTGASINFACLPPLHRSTESPLRLNVKTPRNDRITHTHHP